jgi:two-component sensor histidine kinase
MTIVKERNDLDATRIRALRRALDHRRLSVQHQTPDLGHTLSENLPENWRETAQLPAEADERIELLGKAVLQGSTSATTEIERYDGGVRSIHEVTCLPDKAADGTISGIVTVIADVTETREREMALASLMREVSHRSKNLLAIVLSIAAQTASHAGSIDDFLAKFRGRVQALAWTQDLVTESNWLGTPFQRLVLAQLAQGRREPPRGIELLGDNPTLGPNAALHVGLAMHELITNATAHGALSNGAPGHIRVGAKLDYVDGVGLQLIIDWQERLAPRASEAEPGHFGSIVLRQVVPRSLGGKAEFDIGKDSVRYRLVVPGDQFTV